MKKNIFIIMGLFLSLSTIINAATIRLSPVTVEILSHQKASSISLYNRPLAKVVIASSSDLPVQRLS